MTEHRIYSFEFSRIYDLYVKKVERKDRTVAELDEVIRWLTGYSQQQLQQCIDGDTDMRKFFEGAPALNESRSAIKGVICGVRIEEIEDPLMREIRYLDKLVDELAKGKAMEKVLRN